jgi:hypothetical protein
MVFSCCASHKKQGPEAEASGPDAPFRKLAYSAACSSFSKTRGGDMGSA